MLHTAGFALAGFDHAPAPPSRAATITIHDVAVPVAPIVAPVMTLAAVPIEIAAPAVEIADANPVASGDCAVTDGLQKALASDPAVATALAALPVAARSTANAVTVWNDRWAARDGDAVRAAVVAGLTAMPASCRAIAVTGPRLLIVPVGARPVVLAFGSGTWRWSDLLADAATIGVT